MTAAYIAPYRLLLKEIGIDPAKNGRDVKLTRDQFETLIKCLLKGVKVDEDWYRKSYPDVDEAIASGSYKSAKHHFVENGYFEGRKPFKPEVDEEWYVAAYQDVRDGIEFGEIGSAQEHFEAHGEDEGRRPREW